MDNKCHNCDFRDVIEEISERGFLMYEVCAFQVAGFPYVRNCDHHETSVEEPEKEWDDAVE